MRGGKVALRWQSVEAALFIVSSNHNRSHASIASPTTPAFQLLTHSRHWCRVTATWAGCGTALHRRVEFRMFDFGFEVGLVNPAVPLLRDDLKVHALGFLVRNDLQRDGAVGFLRKPEGADEWHFRAAAGAFALNRPRPEIGDGRRAVRVLGIELGQFLLGFALDPVAPFADFIGEALAVFGDVFEDDLVEQHRHGIEVAGKGVRAHAQGFERNGAAAAKRVHDERARAGRAAQRLVRRLRERAAGVEVFADGGVVPIGKVGNEVEEGGAELEVRSSAFRRRGGG